MKICGQWFPRGKNSREKDLKTRTKLIFGE